MNDKVTAIILAAGKGSRMSSNIPKVLHQIAGKTLIEYVIDKVKEICDNIVIVVGYKSEQIIEYLQNKYQNIQFIEQKQQLGTGHAVIQALENSKKIHSKTLILYGDVPFVQKTTIEKLITLNQGYALTLFTASLNNPFGYGRIIRGENQEILKIVEEKDANSEEKNINEINSGILVSDSSHLKKWLSTLNNNNQQKEYYLTDITEKCVRDNLPLNSFCTLNELEITGVNSTDQLVELEMQYQRKIVDNYCLNGLKVADKNTVYFRGDFSFRKNCFVDVNVIFEGKNKIGKNVQIGANCIIKNSNIGNDVKIKPFSYLENVDIADKCSIGPYARLRPNTQLEEGVNIGNFVEVKKTKIAKQSKVNHLSYIGDAKIGENSNIGAGTITCNYDGANKHLSQIGSNVFIGSGTQLVAPITIEDNATVGAGSTLSKKVQQNSLVLTRAKITEKKGWKRPLKTTNNKTKGPN